MKLDTIFESGNYTFIIKRLDKKEIGLFNQLNAFFKKQNLDDLDITIFRTTVKTRRPSLALHILEQLKPYIILKKSVEHIRHIKV
jgi:hypothetical protein